jgi:hypothetical protein
VFTWIVRAVVLLVMVVVVMVVMFTARTVSLWGEFFRDICDIGWNFTIEVGVLNEFFDCVRLY